MSAQFVEWMICGASQFRLVGMMGRTWGIQREIVEHNYSVNINKKLAKLAYLEKDNQFSAVRELCDEIIEENDCCSEAYVARSRVFFRDRDVSAGFSDLDRVIELVPDAPGAYLMRARRHLEFGNFFAALSDANMIVQFNEKYYLEIGYFYQAIANLALRRVGEARAAALSLPDEFRMYVITPNQGRQFYSRSDLLNLCVP